MARCKGVRHVARPSLRTPLHDLGPSTPSPPRPRTHPARTHTYVLPALVHSFILAISHARTLQRQTTDNFKDRGGRGGRDPDQCNLTMQATSSHHYNGHHISAPWVHHHVLVCVVYVGSTHTDLDLVFCKSSSVKNVVSSLSFLTCTRSRIAAISSFPSFFGR